MKAVNFHHSRLQISGFRSQQNKQADDTKNEYSEPFKTNIDEETKPSKHHQGELSVASLKKIQNKWVVKTTANTMKQKPSKGIGGVREARTLDLRISRSYETYALANCATTPRCELDASFI